jgi:hypothetical protein
MLQHGAERNMFQHHHMLHQSRRIAANPKPMNRSRASHRAEAAHDISRRTSSVAQMMSWTSI